MKFSGKITKLYVGGTISCTFLLSALALNLQPQITKASVTQLAQTLTPEEVNLRAKQITVRIDGASVGSGSLIEYSNNVYTVLTNWHVMKNPGEYIVQTIDGRKHPVDPASIKKLPGLDLAILQFTTNQNYQLAEIGNSGNLNEGQSIYFAGYPGELRKEDNRYYRFFPANLVGILPKSTENGYSLIYNGEAFPGMSGGPVFNQEGLMIGIHGEANVNAISGGTSNYAIPMNSYQEAIGSATSQSEIAKPDSQPIAKNPAPAVEETNIPETSSPPTTDVANQPEVESTPESEPTNPTSSQPDNSDQPEVSTDPDTITSVPTFTPAPTQETVNSEVENEVAESNESPTPDVVVESSAETESQPETDEALNQPNGSEAATTDAAKIPNKIALISEKTGIDYSVLRDLLKNQKWSEADLHTYKLIEQIVKTAKQQNKHVFIELKTIAEFSCPDITTIDYLWKKYSGNKFGFSSQQEVWQSVNQKGDFSTETWRQFATQVGWKKGEVSSGTGYLLYEQLSFNPTEAPVGHLPWWFALPEVEQKVIKHLFARCNFNPSAQEVEAEARDNKPPNNSQNTSDSQSEAAKNSESIIDQEPKSSNNHLSKNS
ncbi:GUN4 domain-containing protein [Pleurocapsa sp. PCC 7319]|uniref:GUN4 domain-containing protein n=1 Tax=Pleurocapsa sp. PCC 7319 TaxID=118161 RepID=UPI000349B140|nr:GUN4 domain-containing protein [Pleurocapsa sp. PCC 7319]